ncbi:Transmembrane 9 superfamily member 12 [Capsicum baccatum]|uniref:Transmembrane 9 superfamily member n=1 Tax=Capsicum baccatum TaxID=33114 RepID=A0A2G2WAY9_CAPBA|nr:Transmembrane 9 superfamily member 12 [Capsicum baccatum]
MDKLRNLATKGVKKFCPGSGSGSKKRITSGRGSSSNRYTRVPSPPIPLGTPFEEEIGVRAHDMDYVEAQENYGIEEENEIDAVNLDEDNENIAETPAVGDANVRFESVNLPSRPPSAPKPRKRTSIAWQFFERISDIEVQCNICQQIYKHRSGGKQGGSDTLMRHIAEDHKRELNIAKGGGDVVPDLDHPDMIKKPLKMRSFDKFKIWVLFICLISELGYGFYLPGSYPHKYGVGDFLNVKVNSLTSIDTELPYSYYSLPFCQPQEGVKDSAENLGELLMGDRIENSPYRFKMYTNETEIFTCQTKPLSGEEFNLLKKRIDEMYQVNLILDNLPAIRYTRKEGYFLRWTGYPVGIKVQDAYYVFNHLKFTVLVHKYEETNVARVMGTGDGAVLISTVRKVGSEAPGYMVVGFEVVPCSVQHGPDATKNLKMYSKYPTPIKCDPTTVAMAIKENEPVSFTYEVNFVESDIKWPSRWDAYLKMEGAKVHWFSILNSLMVITFLAGIVLVIFLRTVRRDLTRYEELDKEAQSQMNEELSGWKLVVSDVFRAPSNPALLCAMVGDGVQILGMGVVTILFAALGFMSPASRGTLITGMLFFYMILGVSAGYVAVRLWRTICCGDHKGWVSVSWKAAYFFPGIALLILTTLNFLLWGSHSTGAIPFSLFVILILLWVCISVPLTLLGGYLGAKAPHIEYPVRTNQIPREIPPQKYPSWLLVLGAGTLPFGTLFIELFFIMSSLWMGRVYYVFGFLLIVMILLVVVCAEVSLVLTYMHLCVEDWKWWWKSFFASGSVSIYIFLYSVNYLIFDLKSLSGPVSATLYLGYSLFMVLAIMFATGTVGFLSSFWFVHYLFSSVKLD